MLDGRVLGASQVEYKPFGKPPLKREIRSYGHTAAWHCATLLRLPGIEASVYEST